CDDFFIAGTQNWITQVSASLVEIPNGVGPRGRGTSKPFDLGKNVPDPVTAFAASPNFREGRVVAGTTPCLSFVKSFQRHRSADRGQRTEDRGIFKQTPNLPTPKLRTPISELPSSNFDLSGLASLRETSVIQGREQVFTRRR